MKTTNDKIQECFEQFRKVKDLDHFAEISFRIVDIPLGDMMDLEKMYERTSTYSETLNVTTFIRSFHEGRCLIYFYSEPVAQHIQYTPLTDNITA